MILRNTNGIGATSGNAARLDTLVAFTGLSHRAICIGSAARNTLDTLANLIGTAFAVTFADLLANIVDAEFMRQASIITVTEGPAKSGMTLEASGALVVGDTCCWFSGTSNDRCGVGQKSCQAGTLSSLVHHGTLSIGTARSLSTWIGALVGHTRLRRGTISSTFATHGTNATQADMSKETVVVQFASEHTLSLGTSFVIGAIIVGSARQHANAIGTNHSSGTSLG